MRHDVRPGAEVLPGLHPHPRDVEDALVHVRCEQLVGVLPCLVGLRRIHALRKPQAKQEGGGLGAAGAGGVYSVCVWP